MTLRHEIETNVNRRSNTDNYFRLYNIINQLAEMHRCEIQVDDLEPCLRIIVEGNGAVLRDVVTALDQAGYLD